MIYFPNAKINLGLRVLGRREDGFHNLHSAFIPIGWSDVLEVNLVENGSRGRLNFSIAGHENYVQTVRGAGYRFSTHINT